MGAVKGPGRGRPGRAGHGGAARRGATGHRAGLLRRAHLPRGGPAARPAGGHRQEPDPQRHAPHARRPRRRRDPGGGRVMSHNEASELLGVYALDAVDGEELTELEAHLVTCPRCRAELDGLREVAAAIGNTVEPLPEGLWSSIASRLPERHDEDAEAPPMPRLDSEGRSPFRPPPDGRSRRRRTVVAALGAAAVAAAAVA